MKKYLKLFAIILCVAISSAILFACGGSNPAPATIALTEENLVGNYVGTYMTYTPDASAVENHNRHATTCTKAEYEAILANGATTDEENLKFDAFDDTYLYNFTVGENGTAWREQDTQSNPCAKWAISANGQLLWEVKYDYEIGSAKWDNGKIILTYYSGGGSDVSGTYVVVFEKVAE